MSSEIQELKNEYFRLRDKLNCQEELNKELERKIDDLLREKTKDKEMIYKLTQKLLNM